MTMVVAAAALYLISLVWIALYPILNVSSGEAKPRGLYVDENALLLRSELATFKEDSISVNKTGSCVLSSPCDLFREEGALCTDFRGQHEAFQGIEVEMVGLSSDESIILVIPYATDCRATHDQLVLLLQIGLKLTRNLLASAWLAKKIIILYVPDDGRCAHEQNLFSSYRSLETWLDRPTKNYPKGLLRTAYVVDLSHAFSSDNLSLEWDEILLQLIGINGQLPNMDMISVPVEMFPSVVTTEGDADICRDLSLTLPFEGNKNVMEKWPSYFFRLSEGGSSSYLHKLCSLAVFARDVVNGTSLALAFARDSFHLSFASLPGPSGLHALLLRRNIDALTLQPRKANKNPQKSSGSFTNLLLRLVYVSNNLHEELHHAHFFYLLLGQR